MNKYSQQQCQHRSHKRFCSSVRANNSEFGCRWNILVTLHINKINSEKLLKPNLKLVFLLLCPLLGTVCGARHWPPAAISPERANQTPSCFLCDGSIPPSEQHKLFRQAPPHSPAFPCVHAVFCGRVFLSLPIFWRDVLFFCFFSEVVNKEIWCDDDRCTGTVR